MSAQTPSAGARHRPVLPAEVLHYLNPQPGQTVVDATVGAGGHARLVAERLGTSGRLIGLDQDPAMLELARRQLAESPVTLVHANFDQLPALLAEHKLGCVDGVLADLGFCSDQVEDPSRGLSFQSSGPLDMRLDPGVGEPASSLLESTSERELADLFWEYGEERFSRRIARKIVETRKRHPLRTTEELAELVRSCVRWPRGRGQHIDPATRVFQALRIAVNDELAALERLLSVLPGCLKPDGRALIISFHSLEDRRVKQAFRDGARWEPLTRKPVQANDDEIRNNPRARSAKLRAARRKREGEE